MEQIALVHDFLYTYGGAERVLKQFHEMYPDAPIYTLFARPELVKTHFPNATIITSGLQKNLLNRWPWLLLPNYPRAIESFTFNDYKTVLSSSGAFSHGIITGAITKHICYCHTPMRYAWDWNHEYLAERGITSFTGKLFAQSMLSKLRLWDAISAKRVDTYLANSTVVQNRIAKFYRQKSLVVHPPIEESYFTTELIPMAKREEYLVTASRLTPNKRIDAIIRAAAEAHIPLVIIGEGSDRQRLLTVAERSKAKVTFTGYISEVEKQEIIRKARAFVFAAEDDFGIAPAEALALGTPLITLAKGGILDILTAKNSVSFAEISTQSMAQILATDFSTLSATEIRESVRSLSIATFREAIRKQVDNA